MITYFYKQLKYVFYLIILLMFNYKQLLTFIHNNGDWGLGPIPNPQSPIPNLTNSLFINKLINFIIQVKQIK